MATLPWRAPAKMDSTRWRYCCNWVLCTSTSMLASTTGRLPCNACASTASSCGVCGALNNRSQPTAATPCPARAWSMRACRWRGRGGAKPRLLRLASSMATTTTPTGGWAGAEKPASKSCSRRCKGAHSGDTHSSASSTRLPSTRGTHRRQAREAASMPTHSCAARRGVPRPGDREAVKTVDEFAPDQQPPPPGECEAPCCRSLAIDYPKLFLPVPCIYFVGPCCASCLR